jgi:hypothetical protein
VISASWVIVLAEDPCHQQFVRKYLYRLGFSRHQLDFRAVSHGRGSGEHWVRQQYPKAVQDYRVRSARAETALVAIIDADTGDVDRRHRQFQDALKLGGLVPRSNNETVVHLSPRRNIEAWILHLTGESVDEETDYKGKDVDALINGAAETFFEWCRPNTQIPERCLPSLRAAIDETKRLA